MSQIADHRNAHGLRRRMTFTLAVSAAIFLVPSVLIAVFDAYWRAVPWHSASLEIGELQTRLTLRFYGMWGHGADPGRQLTVRTPQGTTTVAMTAADWPHNARTSVYLTPDRQIAILGPIGDDYLVSLDPLTVSRARGSGDNWTYLGAFDYELLPRSERQLRFIKADEQAECIPMRGSDVDAWQARKAARQRDCIHYMHVVAQ
jgi:hypothetical protein